MEYFSFYNLPPSLDIDADELKVRFYAKSRELHPDFHSMENEESQARITDLAAFNNKAYLTLRDVASRIEYILTQNNLLAPEGENKLPQSFLIEMMELNEALMEVKMDPSPESIGLVRDQIATARKDLDDSISPLFDTDNIDSFSENEWDALRDYHLKLKYLQRLDQNLMKEA